MSARQRWVGLVVVGLLGAIAALTLLPDRHSWAGPRPVPGRTAQFPTTPEPPLEGTPPAPAAPVPRAPVPRVESAPPAAQPPDEGTNSPEDPPAPVVAIRVRVPATAAAGQELEYRIVVENRANAAAHHVIVRSPVPANARFVRATPEPSTREPELTWNLGTLEACACREIVLVLTPTGAGDVVECARVQFEHGQCVTTKIVRPALSLRKCGPEQAVINETLTFQLIVTNTGAAEAVAVVITDEIPEGLEHTSGKRHLTFDVGALAPGQTRSFDYQVVAKARGRFCNRAVAATPSGLREVAESCVNVAEAKMALAKKGPERRYLGQPATYEITVTNTGTTVLNNVVVRDPVPAGMRFVHADAGQLTGNEVHWLVGSLQPNASRMVEVVLTADQAGTVRNQAFASAERGVTAQAEARTEFVGVSGLHLSIDDTGYDPVMIGGDAHYVIVVRNQGTAAITNVKLEMTAPAEMSVTGATGTADVRKDGQKVIAQPFNLAPRGEARFTVSGKVLRPGSVRFKAEVTADQLTSGSVQKEESTTFYAEPAAPGR